MDKLGLFNIFSLPTVYGLSEIESTPREDDTVNHVSKRGRYSLFWVDPKCLLYWPKKTN